MRAAIVTGLALALVCLPATVARGSSPSAELQPLPVDAELDPDSQVRALFENGMTQFEAGEYEQALILWKRAFVFLPHDAAVQGARAVLITNIVTAHVRAYELGHNREHLAEALRVLELRKAELVYVPTEQATREDLDLDARRSEVEQLHEAALKSNHQASPLPDGTVFQIVGPPPPPTPERTPEQRDAVLLTNPQFRHGKKLSDAGIVMMAVGSGTLITGTLLSTFLGGEPVIILPVMCVTGAIAIAGSTFFVLGNDNKQLARRGLTAMPMPLTLRGGGGLGFAGRF
jgi:hypothetical protein